MALSVARIRARAISVSLIVALLWGNAVETLRAANPAPTIAAVAALSDPARLATLKGERAANERLHRILAYLEEARRAGTLPSKIIDEAQKLNADTGSHGLAVKEMLLRNFEFAERAALFTEENLARMKHGNSPYVTNGTFKGQPYEVDHIIPLAEFPQLGRELANLIYLPRTLNRRKSDDIKQRALDLATKLVAAGVLTADDYEKLKRSR